MTVCQTCLQHVESGRAIDRAEALALLAEAERDPWPLLAAADSVRRRFRGLTVNLCSITAVKVGRCGEDCRWCAQSARWPTGLEPHGLPTAAELLRAAETAASNGARNFGMVSSGSRLSDAELQMLGAAAADIRRHTGLGVCGSFGALTAEKARRLREAGFVRYNHNLETSARFFPSVCSTHTYEDRVATARAVLDAGMELCSGGLMGMGETDEDRVDLALAVRDLGAHVVPVNFLHPIPGTPLADLEPVPPLKILSVLAMFRLVMPDRIIKMAGGREKNLGQLQSLMFMAGADSCIVGNYLTTTGRPAEEDLALIRDLGLQPAPRPGQGSAGGEGESGHHGSLA
jgi:biotin synthase